MASVRTVLGDIPSDQLGVTNAHEHLFIRNGLILLLEPDFRLDCEDSASSEVIDYREHGGQALLEATPIGVGRDPEALAAVSKATGVHIIAATGLHKPGYYIDTHWRNRLTVDEIAEIFIDEVCNGMDAFGFEGPARRKTSVRAGVIKAASEYQRIAESSRIGFEAAAIAHLRTGAPIITHTEMGTMAEEQLSLLQSYGVNPQNIILSHMDRNPDWMLHRDLAKSGAFLEYDGPGRVKYMPESTILELLTKMFDLGCGDKILLGGDTARRSYWKVRGGNTGIAYITERFVPRLRREGFNDSQIHSLLVENPAKAFAMASKINSSPLEGK